MLQGITEEVKKQAEQRINSQFIMWVRGIQKLALKNAQRVDVMETLQNHKTIKMTRDYLESAKKHNYGTIVERYMEDEQHQSACTNKDTRNPTWKNLTELHMKTGFTSLLLMNGLTAETNLRSITPYHGAGSDTVMTEEHPEYKQIVLRERENMTTDVDQWLTRYLWSPPCIKVYMVGFFFTTNMVTITITYRI